MRYIFHNVRCEYRHSQTCAGRLSMLTVRRWRSWWRASPPTFSGRHRSPQRCIDYSNDHSEFRPRSLRYSRRHCSLHTSFPTFQFCLIQFILGLLLPPVSSLNGLPANTLCSHAIIRASIIIISSGWRTTFHHLAIAIVILDRSAAHRSTALVEQRCRSCAIILPAACIRYTATNWDRYYASCDNYSPISSSLILVK
jgi:hypothetical protein